MAYETWQNARSVTRVEGFRDREFDYQLLKLIGLAEYGGSTPGECLATAGMVPDGDTTAWVRAFGALADRVEGAADACAGAGRPVSARDHWLRAATYHRAAADYADRDPAALLERGRRNRACFARAADLTASPRIVGVTFPFGAAALPGYVVTADDGSTPRRTLVAMGGFDATAEELVLQFGFGGAARGWRVVAFDGPGQADSAWREPGLTFAADAERPVGAVLDHLARRDGAPLGAVALLGTSIGGYFAARAAAHDRRVGALVCDIPVVDLKRYLRELLGPPLFDSRQDLRPEDVAGIPEDLFPRQTAWGILAACRRFGVGSFHELKDALTAYRLGPAVAGIACPVLAIRGEREDGEVARQAEELAAGASGAVDVRCMTLDEGADAHAQVGTLRLLNQVVYDWLDDRLPPA